MNESQTKCSSILLGILEIIRPDFDVIGIVCAKFVAAVDSKDVVVEDRCCCCCLDSLSVLPPRLVCRFKDGTVQENAVVCIIVGSTERRFCSEALRLFGGQIKPAEDGDGDDVSLIKAVENIAMKRLKTS
jgi:hypothetical protein